MVVDVASEERYWYPDDGGIVWLAGFQLVDASGSFLARDAPEVVARGLRVASVAGAGSWHRDALASDAAAPGAPLVLVRDPENEHDADAIAVHLALSGEQLGWVPRALAAEVAPSLDAGEPWSALVLRERRASPRDPRTGATMLLARDAELKLRESS